MERIELEQKAIVIVSEALNVSKEKVEINSEFVKDLGADSLDVVELLMAFEDEFGITVEDDKAVTFKTVKDIVDYIEENID